MIGAILGAVGSIAGGLIGKSASDSAAKKNAALQREFAQNGIQWKVADAKKAGIHPLYALGAQTHAASPVYVGDNSFGTGIAAAGQDIGRAIDSTRSAPERANAVQKTMNDLTLQRMGLENELLASQIAKIRQAGNPPAMPAPESAYLIPGQGSTVSGPAIETVPLERVASSPSALSQEPGAINDVGFVRTRTGYMPVQSEDAKQRLEEDLVGNILWNIRNRLVPMSGYGLNPPQVPPPEGYDYWDYDPVAHEYRPRRRRWGPDAWGYAPDR